jgi:glycosyltransferase involved in cell wall biosynthesis
MVNTCPRISIIIPTYNRGSLIQATLESIRQQTYTDYEVIIVDDASQDNTVTWIAQHYSQYRLISLPNNRGGAAARNVGLQVAQGEFIAFLDHDDQWLPDYLITLLKAFELTPEAVMVYGDYFEVREDGTQVLNKLHPWAIYSDFTYHILMQNVIHTLSITIIRKSALIEVGFFQESLKICNDVELYLRLSSYGKIIHIPEALVLKYRHRGNLCNNYWLWYQDILQVYTLFFEASISKPYTHLKGQIKCHALVTLFKVVWKYKQDYLFARKRSGG